MKILTKAIEKQLLKHPIGSQDGKGAEAKVLVKLFNPYGVGTWLVTEAEKQADGDWLLYGAAEMGHGFEWGYSSLNELLSIIKFGRPAIEREMYGPPDTVGEAWEGA